MNALDEKPQAVPPPLPRGTPEFLAKIGAYRAARSSYLKKCATRRVVAIVTLLAVAIIGADIAHGWPVWARWVALGVLVLTAIDLLSRRWWGPRRRLDDAAAAREVEHGFPVLGQRLRTVREVQGAPEGTQVSPELAKALEVDTREQMRSVDPHTLIPWKDLRWPTVAAVGAALLFGGLFVRSSEFRTGTARLLLPSAGFSYTKIALEPVPAKFTDQENPVIVAHISGRSVAEATLMLREEGGAWTPLKMTPSDARRRFDIILTGRTKSLDFYVMAGDGETGRRHMRCLVTPKVEKAWSELEFPEYTGHLLRPLLSLIPGIKLTIDGAAVGVRGIGDHVET